MEIINSNNLDSSTEFIPFDTSNYTSQQLQCFMPFKPNNILSNSLSFIDLKKNKYNNLTFNTALSLINPINLKINMFTQNLHHNIAKSLEKNLDNRYSLKDDLSSISLKASNIVSSIEDTNPAILKTLEAYNIPYPISELLIKKIVLITLESELIV